MQIKIEIASVKVMRSFDYCHFEVCLSSSAANTPEAVDELRKTAARLADKAVEQYKVAKRNYAKRETEHYERQNEVSRMKFIRDTPEGDRTVSQQAQLKAFDDAKWETSHAYDYEDEWNED